MNPSRLLQIACLCLSPTFALDSSAQRWMEHLDRGVVAVHEGEGRVFVGWRMLGTDPDDVAYNVYRFTGTGASVKLNEAPLTDVTWFADTGADVATGLRYSVRAIVDGNELEAGAGFSLPKNASVRPYLPLPLQTPDGYRPGDLSVGDLTGDGQYEIVVHQTGRGRDNSHGGMTTPPVFEAYRMDGTMLWRINLGRNIREGAHYTQFLVYDFDGDGRAEFVCKTADGTIDGEGNAIGDPEADHRESDGRAVGKILRGPEFLTVFDGRTGAELSTVNYIPARHPETNSPTPRQQDELWGDDYGNRMDRFLAGVAYLDGERPSIVMTRGYYTRTVVAAWDWRDGRLKSRWVFDSDDGDPENRAYRGQGNHSLSVMDVDGDGRDEIVFGACVIDDDGTGLYSTGLGHGDAQHASDLDPTRGGLEIFSIHENARHEHGIEMRDARTGEILWSKRSSDVGRGLAIDLDPRHPGHEVWASGPGLGALYNVKGGTISERKPRSCNFAIWWDGDLLRELLNGNRVSKWEWDTAAETVLLEDEEVTSINGSKASPGLSADLFGDWREEVVWPTRDGRELRIYTTTIPTDHRLRTLMHDPQYRLSVAWQNVAYNQPPHTGFFLGHGMRPPPRPLIKTVNPRD